jgi:hypothetical protein
MGCPNPLIASFLLHIGNSTADLSRCRKGSPPMKLSVGLIVLAASIVATGCASHHHHHRSTIQPPPADPGYQPPPAPPVGQSDDSITWLDESGNVIEVTRIQEKAAPPGCIECRPSSKCGPGGYVCKCRTKDGTYVTRYFSSGFGKCSEYEIEASAAADAAVASVGTGLVATGTWIRCGASDGPRRISGIASGRNGQEYTLLIDLEGTASKPTVRKVEAFRAESGPIRRRISAESAK